MLEQCGIMSWETWGFATFSKMTSHLCDVTQRDAFFLFSDTREKRKAQGQRAKVGPSVRKKHHVFGYTSDMSIPLYFLGGKGTCINVNKLSRMFSPFVGHTKTYFFIALLCLAI